MLPQTQYVDLNLSSFSLGLSSAVNRHILPLLVYVVLGMESKALDVLHRLLSIELFLVITHGNYKLLLSCVSGKEWCTEAYAFGAWASLLAFHLEVLNWTSIINFLQCQCNFKEHVEKWLKYSLTFELQEQYCESVLFVWLVLVGSKEKRNIWLPPPLLSNFIPASFVIGMQL